MEGKKRDGVGAGGGGGGAVLSKFYVLIVKTCTTNDLIYMGTISLTKTVLGTH